MTADLLGEPSPETSALVATVACTLADTIVPEVAERIAERVLAILAAQPTAAAGQTVDATTLATHLGVTRGFVYEHAQQLGGVRLGNGPRPRLRFDLTRALEAWNARSTSERSQAPRTPAATEQTRAPGRARIGRRAAGLPEPGSVLAIREPRSGRRAA